MAVGRQNAVCLVKLANRRAGEFRTSNIEDHNLAKYALSLEVDRHVWLGQLDDLLFVPVNAMTH